MKIMSLSLSWHYNTYNHSGTHTPVPTVRQQAKESNKNNNAVQISISEFRRSPCNGNPSRTNFADFVRFIVVIVFHLHGDAFYTILRLGRFNFGTLSIRYDNTLLAELFLFSRSTLHWCLWVVYRYPRCECTAKQQCCKANDRALTWWTKRRLFSQESETTRELGMYSTNETHKKMISLEIGCAANMGETKYSNTWRMEMKRRRKKNDSTEYNIIA